MFGRGAPTRLHPVSPPLEETAVGNDQGRNGGTEAPIPCDHSRFVPASRLQSAVGQITDCDSPGAPSCHRGGSGPSFRGISVWRKAGSAGSSLSGQPPVKGRERPARPRAGAGWSSHRGRGSRSPLDGRFHALTKLGHNVVELPLKEAHPQPRYFAAHRCLHAQK